MREEEWRGEEGRAGMRDEFVRDEEGASEEFIVVGEDE